MKTVNAIKAIEKAGYEKLECSNGQLVSFRKGAAHLTIYTIRQRTSHGTSGNAAMIEVKRFGSAGRGILETTIKSALNFGEKFYSGEWK